MFLTSVAVLLATSFADCTNCLLAAGLLVLADAALHALHRAEVCLATDVAAPKTCQHKNKTPWLRIQGCTEFTCPG